ncbi:MAG: helix-hairpin-helix domain-containing protein [Caulobacterales bacterium]|nr:helix-hairpin-helix domain-containing protein [Caulobacterales bacterium]MCA0371600.1 helix-hairpin-helix domain-containing protein [Pseudomonadota bacterium]
MKFTNEDREKLLAAKFVGDKVIDRLEEIGIYNFEILSQSTPEFICKMVAAHIGVSCWGNSPQARKAIENAIMVARENH